MFCSNCGRNDFIEANFCSQCGFQLRNNKEQYAAKEASEKHLNRIEIANKVGLEPYQNGKPEAGIKRGYGYRRDPIGLTKLRVGTKRSAVKFGQAILIFTGLIFVVFIIRTGISIVSEINSETNLKSAVNTLSLGSSPSQLEVNNALCRDYNANSLGFFIPIEAYKKMYKDFNYKVLPLDIPEVMNKKLMTSKFCENTFARWQKVNKGFSSVSSSPVTGGTGHGVTGGSSSPTNSISDPLERDIRQSLLTMCNTIPSDFYNLVIQKKGSTYSVYGYPMDIYGIGLLRIYVLITPQSRVWAPTDTADQYILDTWNCKYTLGSNPF
jgi:hypothetical protein